MHASADGSQQDTPLLAARHVTKFYGEQESRILVLDDISLELHRGDFLALLGPSGSGKSTLLRILAGLLAPSTGEVLVHGRPLTGTNEQAAIVFQSFALYPWLTVQQNTEMGLLAKGVARPERARRARAAIDVIGLDGFEDAYPKELSGGMRQRVGLARALVVEPEVLFMDEPFSALDVLTAQNLREQIIDLWSSHEIPTQAVLMVTHNIDEAVTMANRLVVLEADPGKIRAEIPGLPAHARAKGPEHTALVDAIYKLMTSPGAAVSDVLPTAPTGRPTAPAARPYQVLPHAEIGDITGLLDHLSQQGGSEDLYQLGREFQLEVDELLPLTDALQMLGLANVREGDVLMTNVGRAMAEADVQGEKQIFRTQALDRVQLIQQIMREIENAGTGETVKEERLLEPLEHFFSPAEARRQLDTAIDWGRYAELFEYDDDSGELYAPEEEAAEAVST
jgi:NitT/TauT family transport system ATP-binding protein